MVTTRPKGLLNIPELQQPSRDSFDTRAKHLESWLHELPMGDTGECAKRIFHVLKEVNRLDISGKDRWRVLEAISSPLQEMTANLERHFTNQNLPIAEKNLKIADLCIELYRELALGYKILIDQIWTKQLTFLNTKSAVSMIYRAMYNLYQVLLTAYEVYNDPPPNTWMHIHQLYLYADDNKLTHIVPRDIGVNSDIPRGSIGELYIQIILLGLISPYRLRQMDTKKIVKALKDWSKHCRILPADQLEEKTGHVLIKQNSDYAPGYHFVDKSINHVYTRTIDSSRLIDHISDLVVSQPSRVEQNTPIYDLPADVIKLLIVTLSGKSRRLFSRTDKQNQLAVSVGVNATHFMISNMQNLHPNLVEISPYATLIKSVAADQYQAFVDLQAKDELKFESEAHFEAAPLFGISTIDNASADVWDDDYNSKTLGYSYNLEIWQKSKTETPTKNKDAYHQVHCDNINESANGYCLFSDLRHESNPTKVQVGELIGIRNDQSRKKQDAFDLGTIRRLKNTEKGIELGIQKLAPSADAIAICHYHKRNFNLLKYQRALLLPALKTLNQPPTLVANKIFKVGDELMINKLGFKMKIQLTRIIETTGEFNQFEFDIKKVIGIESEQASKEAGKNKDFDTVWTLI